jgi:2-keto-4-pentenoate hydratase
MRNTSLDTPACQAAADLLYHNWQSGTLIDGLPPEMRPSNRATGYAIQALLEQRSRQPLFGWKIAATSKAGQAHINVDGPLAGRLLAERVIPLGQAVHLGTTQMRVAEPEFCFRMGQDLSPQKESRSCEEVMAAVVALHLAIEIPDSRFADFVSVGAPQLIADNACGHEFILGPEAPAIWRDIDLVQHVVTGSIDGKLRREGKGANVLGDPCIALTWLANEVSQLGLTLRAGEVVTTGTCMVPLAVEPGDHVTIDYGRLGHMTASFAA